MSALVIQGIPADCREPRTFDSMTGSNVSMSFCMEHPEELNPKYKELFEVQGQPNIDAILAAEKAGKLIHVKAFPRMVAGSGLKPDGTPRKNWTKYVVLRVLA